MKNDVKRAVPPQRTKDLVVRTHGKETLVLDRPTGTVHCLSTEVTRVWGACTGRATLAEIASAADVDEPTAASAVDELMRLDLLEVRPGFDRRKFLRRSALVSVGAATVIESVVALPAKANASAFPELGDVMFFPSCVAAGNSQAQFYVTFSHGTPGLPLLLEASTIHPGGGQDITVTTTGFSLNGSGDANSPSVSMPDSAYESATGTTTLNVYGVPTTITINIYRTDTTPNQLLASIQRTIGPCFNPARGTVTFTSACNNGQAQWGASLSGFDGLAIITMTATATSPVSGSVSETFRVTTANNGSATISNHNFGSPGDFPVDTPVTLTVSEGGNTFETQVETETACPLPPGAARSSGTARSRSSSSKSKPSRTASSPAPAKPSSAKPAPATKPSASPSPTPPRATGPKPSTAGHKPSTAGHKPPATGHKPPTAGGKPSANGGKRRGTHRRKP